MAHHRLQVRQLLRGLDPLPVQLECIDTLDTSDLALGLGAILLRVQQVLRFSKELLAADMSDTSTNMQEKAAGLIREMNSALAKLESGYVGVPPSWQPRYLQAVHHPEIQHILHTASLPAISQVRLYHDSWIAYQMNFYNQGSITLRSAFVDTMAWTASNASDADHLERLSQDAQTQHTMIVRSADALVESIPILIGPTEFRTSEVEFCHGKKISQCFAKTACWTLQQCTHITPEHKSFADRAISWMQRSHGLPGAS
jgi:hypothetical protein